MADDNKHDEMDVEEQDDGTSTPPLPISENDAETNLNQDSILKKSVSSLPAAFGRSSSMGHSLRIKLAADEKKEWFDEVVDEYYEGEFLAVRCAGKDDFWICQVNADQKPGDREIDVHWLERVGGSPTRYTTGKDEVVPAGSVLTRVSMHKVTKKEWKLPYHQYKGVMKMLLDDEEFEGDATDEKDESVDDSFEEPQEDDEDEVEEEEKSTPKKRGRPRKTPAKKAKKDAEDDEEEESSKKAPKKRAPRRKSVGKVDDEETEETPKKRGRKRKRADDDEAEGERPAKKQKKRRKNGPVQGEPNKHIPVVDTDPTFSHNGEDITKCCIQCASREVIRAVFTKNMDLLNKLIDDKENVWSLETQQAADIEENAITYAFKTNNMDALKVFLDPETLKKPRAPQPGYALVREHTGSYSKYTFGHAVRALTVGRGGKEGNNAFTTDIDDGDDDRKVISYNNINYNNLVSLVMKSPLSKEALQILLDNFNKSQELNALAENVYQAVQAGNREVAIFFVDMFNKRGGWGYNNLHYQALAFNGEEMEKFKPVSARKKTIGNMSLTPIHMACINPNPKYLKTLLAASGLVNIEDGMQRSPAHYAAACTGSGPLDFLLAQGVDYFEGDLSGVTPLMIAAKYGRLACVNSLTRGRLNQNVFKRVVNNTHLHEKLAEKINQAMKKMGDEGELSSEVIDKIVNDFVNNEAEALLKEEPEEQAQDEAMAENNTNQQAAGEAMNVDEENEGGEEAEADVKIKEIKDVVYIDVPDMFGRTALHYAAEFGHADVVKLLIRRGASLEVLDKIKMTPLAVAAQQGHFECVKALVEGGANIEARDKVRRTPLIHAVKNGSVTVASYLVHMGADPNTSDSSINSAVHYAAAFGWKECLKYLISVGADANANNLWKTSPLALAMMKGHLACADILLDQKGVDVNVRNDDGDTLVIQVLRRAVMNPSALAQIRFLVQDKKADVNLADRSGAFPLTIAIQNGAKNRLEIVQILIENGAKVDIETDPVNQAFQLHAFDVAQYLIEKDVPVRSSAIVVQQIFNRVLQGVAGEDFTGLLKLVATKEPDFRKVHSQRTGYLSMISQFCAKYERKPNQNNYNYNANAPKPNVDHYFAFMETFFQLVDVDPKEQIPFTPVTQVGGGGFALTQRNADAGKTTLHFVSCMKNDEYEDRLLALLSKAGALPINMLDEAGHTPLTRAIASSRKTLVTKLLDLGAEINLHDEKGQYIPLHLVIQSGFIDLAQLFITKGASVNSVNVSGDTPLHLAVNSNSLELARTLLPRGADVNAKDRKGNTLLHTAVKKRNVEMVKMLIEAKADVNATGYKARTPLHLAIEGSSAIIDSNFELEEMLLRLGASVKAVDSKARTPLHYAFVKTGKGGMSNKNAFDPIDIVATLCADKDCEVDALDVFTKSPLHYAAQHGATISSLYLLGRGAKLDRVDDAKNTPLAIALISGHPQYAISLIREKANVNGKAFIPHRVRGGKLSHTTENSMFDIVVQNSWQGVAYLMLDGGCSYLVAMEASLKVKKYQLLLSLLSKTKDDKVVQQKTERGKTLLHFLAENSGAPLNIAKLLVERGIEPDAVDHSESSALHYAAKSDNLALCQFLVDERKADINRFNLYKQTPLLAYLSSNSNGTFFVGNYLVAKGADINLTVRGGSKDTPLHSAVKTKNDPYIKFCLNSGALIDMQDDQSKTVLMHAVLENDTSMVRILLEGAARNKKKSDLNVKDANGKTAVHLVVSPLEYGSYENVEILELLANHGADLNVKDNDGKTPMYYACLQDSGKMSSALKRLGATQLPMTPMREKSTIYGIVDIGISPEMDADELMKKAEKDTVETVVPKPDTHYGNVRGHVVHSVNDSYYDTLITKVDVQQGAYGQNMFYKMQVLHDQTKDMYVLWTRWGRVGDSGQHQKTPFPTADDAVQEFEKIFKSKTGNDWQERHSFEKKQGKYRLLETDNTTTTVHDVLPKFNLATYNKQKSTLPAHWQTVFEQFANTSTYQTAMRSIGIDTEMMPLGRLSKDKLKQARKILIEIQELIRKKQELSTGLLPDLDEVQTTLEKIVDLSNLFYETIPHANFRYESMHEISDEETIKTKLQMLDNLIDYEAASKIILGSIQRSEEMHPLDYIYKAMNIVLEDVGLLSNEGRVLKKYMENTGRGSLHGYSLHNIFRIQRRGEAERFQKWKDLDNHLLLWHGSSAANFMGILSQGLRIAPPEAPVSGYLFGKGLYFADMLKKSLGYCRYGANGHVFLLLFEVALGNMNELYAPSHSSDLPQGKNSTKGVGRSGPDWSKQVVLPNGVRIPLGAETNYTLPPNTHTSMAYNEYIVYDTTQVRMRYLVHLGPITDINAPGRFSV